MGAITEVAVCVIGAGPVGGTLACLLAAMGVSTAVVDRAPLPPMEHPDFDGRAYAVAAGSRRMLQAAGLWDALPLPACPIHDIRVSDGRIGRAAVAARTCISTAGRRVPRRSAGWWRRAACGWR